MRRIVVIGLLGIGIVMQLSLLPAIKPFGVVPNVALIMMMLVALQLPTSEALIVAVAGGLILDISSGANFGLWTGVFMLGTLAVAMIQQAGIELERPIVAPVLVTLGTMVIAVVLWATMATRVIHFSGAIFFGRFVIELMINLILTVLLRPSLSILLQSRRRQLELGDR